MEIVVSSDGKRWQFKLLEVGGESIDSGSHGSYPMFESYLVVGLMTEPQNMVELFNLLYSLTANHFHGMIVSVNPDDITLASWVVRLLDDETDVLYTCKVGYKAYMPKHKIDYTHELEK